MSKAVQPQREPEDMVSWSSLQAYSLALVCLLLGVTAGYLLRGSAAVPAAAADTAPPVAAATAGSLQFPGMGGMPGSTGMTADQIEKAAQPFLDAIQKNPGDTAAIARLANLYYDAQQYPKAIEYYGQALKIDPRSVDVRTDMATAIWYTGNADAAMAQFEKSLTYNPTHAGTLFNMGVVKWRGKSDPQGAVRVWQKLLQTNPEYASKQHVQELIAQVQENGNRGGPGSR